MKTTLHRAATRGHADHGWLRTAHTFSFGSYHDPLRMNFGALRVLNDDIVQGGSGFGAHGHEQMEIVSIPLQGALAHRDNAGHAGVIRPHDVQVMSAGTGIMHTERNHAAHEPVHFLQLWILPAQQNVLPRYAQHTFDPATWHNQWAFLVLPEQYQGPLWIYQQAFLARACLEAGKCLDYTLHTPAHGVYLFVIEGQVRVAEEDLDRRDGMGVWEVSEVSLTALTACDVLLIEVPLLNQ